MWPFIKLRAEQVTEIYLCHFNHEERHLRWIAKIGNACSGKCDKLWMWIIQWDLKFDEIYHITLFTIGVINSLIFD